MSTRSSGADPEHDLQRVRPRDQGALHPRPASHRPEGRSVPEEHRHRRHQLLGSRGRVLHLRRRPLRPVGAGRLLLHRLGGRRLEHRPAGRPQPGLQAAPQGGLLPLPAGRPVPGPALRDDPHAREGRRPHRGPPPRGRHRRPGRDRHAVRPAHQAGRQPDVLQVHHPQRRAEAWQDGDLHAQADLRRQRLGHALPSKPLERRDEPVLGRAGLRPDQRAGPPLHRRPAQARLRPCWPSARPRPTRIAGWCRATRPR